MTIRADNVEYQDLTPLLHAGSVAIVGISHPDRFGGQIYQNLQTIGYQGDIYGVNPRYDFLFGEPCYPSLSELPVCPDCAILAIPDRVLLPVLEEAADVGIPAAVIFGGAYSEPADSEPSLEDQLTCVARDAGMRICGPNCMGFISFGQRLAISGYPVLPDVPVGNITFISHSGSAFDSLWQNNRQVYFNYVVSSGNEIVTDMADYMLFAMDDPTTRVIALFLETVRAPAKFVAALDTAARRDIPVVALKVGHSEQAKRVTQAHSGALAGEDAAYDAVFDHYGVSRVRSLDEMMDTLELFAMDRRARTQYVATLHDSGGETALLADLAADEGVPLVDVTATTRDRLEAVLEPGLVARNPLDAWGTGNAFQDIYRECLLALDGDPSTALTLFAVDLMRAGSLGDSYAGVVREVQAQLQNPVAFLVNVTAAAGEDQMRVLREAGIPVLMGTETGLRAVRHWLDYSDFQRRRGDEQEPPAVRLKPQQVGNLRQILADAAGPLHEYDSMQLLNAYGIATPAGAVVSSLDEACETAEQIGYPVVLKTAEGELHKSDRGGVQLGLADAAAITNAYRDLEKRFGPRVLVQEMLPAGVELLLGLVNDAQFGPMLTLATGGVLVEVLKDSRLLLLPTNRTAVREALLKLRGAPLLMGVRGRPAADVDAVVDVAMRLSTLAADLGDLIVELDINPLIALQDRAVAVDALVVPQHTSAQTQYHKVTKDSKNTQR